MPVIVLEELLKLGILGPILVALCYLYIQERKRCAASQESRIAEAQAMSETLVKVNLECSKAILLITSALEAQEEITDTMKVKLDAVQEKLKELDAEVDSKRRK